MWFFALLLFFMASETGGPGDVYYSTGKAFGKPDDPDYWWLGVAVEEVFGTPGRQIFAGPYVNRAQAQAAALLHSRGQLGDKWNYGYQASPHGTGYWVWRRAGLAGPFATAALARDWLIAEEDEGRA